MNRIIKQLIKLADELDKKNLHKQANSIDDLMQDVDGTGAMSLDTKESIATSIRNQLQQILKEPVYINSQKDKHIREYLFFFRTKKCDSKFGNRIATLTLTEDSDFDIEDTVLFGFPSCDQKYTNTIDNDLRGALTEDQNQTLLNQTFIDGIKFAQRLPSETLELYEGIEDKLAPH